MDDACEGKIRGKKRTKVENIGERFAKPLLSRTKWRDAVDRKSETALLKSLHLPPLPTTGSKKKKKGKEKY